MCFEYLVNISGHNGSCELWYTMQNTGINIILSSKDGIRLEEQWMFLYKVPINVKKQCMLLISFMTVIYIL